MIIKHDNFNPEYFEKMTGDISQIVKIFFQNFLVGNRQGTKFYRYSDHGGSIKDLYHQ